MLHFVARRIPFTNLSHIILDRAVEVEGGGVANLIEKTNIQEKRKARKAKKHAT